MFAFQSIPVYKSSKQLHFDIRELLARINIDKATQSQLTRASLSVMLNVAEGSGRFSKRDQKHFFVMSRSSLFETVAILEFLNDYEMIDDLTYNDFLLRSEDLSKQLFLIIKGFEK